MGTEEKKAGGGGSMREGKIYMSWVRWRRSVALPKKKKRLVKGSGRQHLGFVMRPFG